MSEAPCTYLEWDSEFFQRRIARVNGSHVDRTRMREILQWCQEHSINCLYFLTEFDDSQTINIAEDIAFRLVDVRLTFEWLGQPISRALPSLIVRPARADDLVELENIASKVHRDSRFFFDPRFSNCAESLYRTWIARCMEGYADVVFVGELDGRPVGYISCYREDADGGIGLFGVDPSVQGLGIGSVLVDHALNWHSKNGVQQVLVVTQGRNLASQRFYQRRGFVTRSVQLWFHKWFD